MRRNRGKTFLFSLMIGVLSFQFFMSAYADGGELEYSFKENSLDWKLSFPAECHPGDTINYSISLSVISPVHTEFFLMIQAVVDQQWIIQYRETLLYEGDYSNQDFDWDITINVPENAHGNLRLFTNTLDSSWGWLNLTTVRSMTYTELEQAYIHLNQSTTELNQSHTILNDKYENLISIYEPFGKLANTRNLMFTFILLTTFLAATTAYSLAERRKV